MFCTFLFYSVLYIAYRHIFQGLSITSKVDIAKAVFFIQPFDPKRDALALDRLRFNALNAANDPAVAQLMPSVVYATTIEGQSAGVLEVSVVGSQLYRTLADWNKMLNGIQYRLMMEVSLQQFSSP